MPQVFPYDRATNPPSPVVLVTLESLDRAAKTDLFMLIDSGADRTILPLSIAESLKLKEIGRREFQGLHGEAELYAILQVRFRIHGRSATIVEVAVGHPDSEPLVGRDVLNLLRIVLDGPNLQLEVS